MSGSLMRRLGAAIATTIDGYGDDDIALPRIIEDVRRSEPELVAQLGDAAVDRLISSRARTYLRPRVDQPAFPGMQIPKHLPIPTEGGAVWRPLVCCTRDDLDAYEQLLVGQIDADERRLVEFRAARRQIVTLLDKHGVDTLKDVP